MPCLFIHSLILTTLYTFLLTRFPSVRSYKDSCPIRRTRMFLLLAPRFNSALFTKRCIFFFWKSFWTLEQALQTLFLIFFFFISIACRIALLLVLLIL